jgi:hypothetical protein
MRPHLPLRGHVAQRERLVLVLRARADLEARRVHALHCARQRRPHLLPGQRCI